MSAPCQRLRLMPGAPAKTDQPVWWIAGCFPLVPPCFPLAAACGLELNAELQAHARHPRQAERGVHRSPAARRAGFAGGGEPTAARIARRDQAVVVRVQFPARTNVVADEPGIDVRAARYGATGGLAVLVRDNFRSARAPAVARPRVLLILLPVVRFILHCYPPSSFPSLIFSRRATLNS
jgi:hypothetical protein